MRLVIHYFLQSLNGGGSPFVSAASWSDARQPHAVAEGVPVSQIIRQVSQVSFPYCHQLPRVNQTNNGCGFILT
jgi:hypothetical protein